MKICKKCKRNLFLNDFYTRESGKPRAECKSCFNEKYKIRYSKNKDSILARNKVYLESHRKEVSKYKSEWQKKNKEKRRIRLNERFKNDINFRIAVLLRTRLIRALRNNQKRGSTLDVLGCSIENFKEYIASKFKEGMSWENHGSIWHIDHIKPCAKFDLSNPKEYKMCFHYTNMQPLFASENMSKKDKFHE